MQRRCVFLTLSEIGDYVIDDELACRAMCKRGWNVETVPWDSRGINWAAFDLAVIRSTWDYHDRPAEFLATLRHIVASGTALHNPVDIVTWNLRKTYLRDLRDKGVNIVPSVFGDRLPENGLSEIFDAVGSDRVVIKPQTGASAAGAHRLGREDSASYRADVQRYFAQTPFLAQPYLGSVETEGEYSLIFLGGAYSHAILKTPKQGDFRTQEEHGSVVQPCRRVDNDLAGAAATAMAAVGRELLYARVDLIRSDSGKDFQLMELELVEPSLYFRTDPEAPERFANAAEKFV